MNVAAENKYIRWLEDVSMADMADAGRKNASLGELTQLLKEGEVGVPAGFVVTVEAYRHFLKVNELEEEIRSRLAALDNDDETLEKVSKSIQKLFSKSKFPPEIASAIGAAYDELGRRLEQNDIDVAVRGSAAAERLLKVSFVGQQTTFLNITGIDNVIEACCKCYGSLFSERAISYRLEHHLDHLEIGLALGIHQMVRSNEACSGVMFTCDPESGFPGVVVINGAWGLGKTVVHGQVNPDEFEVFKPLLPNKKVTPIIEKKLGTKQKKMVYADKGRNTTKIIKTPQKAQDTFILNDDEILQLSRHAVKIEAHYQHAMNIEWAKQDGSGKLFILEAQPENSGGQSPANIFKTYSLNETGKALLAGVAVGQAVVSGKVKLLKRPDDGEQFEEGAILVASRTNPDWFPVLRRAAGIITDEGGRTSHSAVISRELGIPAVIDTQEATQILQNGQQVTVSCIEGEEGFVYDGKLDFDEQEINLKEIPATQTQIMMNIASPAAAFRWWRLPCQGIGLARMEFIIGNMVKIHPLALMRFDELEDKPARRQIESLTQGYEDKRDYFVDKLAYGVAQIAASQYPDRVVVRTSDFKSNEYAALIGGQQFEPEEANPMLGFRGAARYYSDHYREGFALECRALKRVRQEIGLDNVVIMIPFCRTPAEADKVLEIMAEYGLVRGQYGLQIYVMAEIPANIILADEFARRFDGFSIGSNDLTQLLLGIDRDSVLLAELFDERNEAVKRAIKTLINTAHQANCQVGICGQAPSDYPDFAAFLVKLGIDSISLNPDSVIAVKERVAQAERSNLE